MSLKDKHFQNTVYLGIVELFWGIGMNFISMSAILPVMLKNLKASHFEIGLIPSLAAMGFGLPQILSPILFGKKKKLRITLLNLHLITTLPLLLTSYLLFIETTKPKIVILLGWVEYCFLVGIVFPLWMNYLAKVTEPQKRGNSFGIIFFCQTVAGAIGVFLAGRIYGNDFDYKRSALIFFISFASMFLGSFFFLKTKEEGFEEGKISPFVNLKDLIKKYKWFVPYITGRCLSRGAFFVVSSFYIVDIVEKNLQITQSAVSVGAIALISQAVFSLVLGRLGDSLNYKVASIFPVLVFLIVTMIFSVKENYFLHIITAVVLGLYISSEFTSLNNLMISLSDIADRHSIIAWNGFLNTLPQIFIPLIGGLIIDKYEMKYASIFSSFLLLSSLLLFFFFIPQKK